MAQGTTFAVDIGKFSAKAQRRIEMVKKKIVLDLLRRVVFKTPVGNPLYWINPAPPGYVGGRARANWMVAIGHPANRTREIADPGGSMTISVQYNETIQKVKATDQSIFITNHVPYIVRLENGWSHQAPQGMVKITVLEYQGAVSNAIMETRREVG